MPYVSIYKSRSEINKTLNSSDIFIADIQKTLHYCYFLILTPLYHLYDTTSFVIICMYNTLWTKPNIFHIPESRIHSAFLHQPLKWYFLFLRKANGKNPKILLKFSKKSLESKRSKKMDVGIQISILTTQKNVSWSKLS